MTKTPYQLLRDLDLANDDMTELAECLAAPKQAPIKPEEAHRRLLENLANGIDKRISLIELLSSIDPDVLARGMLEEVAKAIETETGMAAEDVIRTAMEECTCEGCVSRRMEEAGQQKLNTDADRADVVVKYFNVKAKTREVVPPPPQVFSDDYGSVLPSQQDAIAIAINETSPREAVSVVASVLGEPIVVLQKGQHTIYMAKTVGDLARKIDPSIVQLATSVPAVH